MSRFFCYDERHIWCHCLAVDAHKRPRYYFYWLFIWWCCARLIFFMERHMLLLFFHVIHWYTLICESGCYLRFRHSFVISLLLRLLSFRYWYFLFITLMPLIHAHHVHADPLLIIAYAAILSAVRWLDIYDYLRYFSLLILFRQYIISLRYCLQVSDTDIGCHSVMMLFSPLFLRCRYFRWHYAILFHDAYYTLSAADGYFRYIWLFSLSHAADITLMLSLIISMPLMLLFFAVLFSCHYFMILRYARPVNLATMDEDPRYHIFATYFSFLWYFHFLRHFRCRDYFSLLLFSRWWLSFLLAFFCCHDIISFSRHYFFAIFIIFISPSNIRCAEIIICCPILIFSHFAIDTPFRSVWLLFAIISAILDAMMLMMVVLSTPRKEYARY